MKTGINISNIPSQITEQSSLGIRERRRKSRILMSCRVRTMKTAPSKRTMLRFPTSNDRFIDNWIVFRHYQGQLMVTI